MGTFDLIKGIAIISVVFLHISFNYSMGDLLLFSPLFVVEKCLNCGLMPMFFIISGYGQKKKDALKVLKQTFSQLILPYLCAAVLSTVLYVVFYWNINGAADMRAAVGMKVTQILLCGDIAGPLWFFVALFWAENIMNAIIKIGNDLWELLAVAACIAAGFALMHLGFFHFRMIQGLTAVGFCYLGYFVKKKNMIERFVHSPWTYLVLGSVWLIQVIGAWQMDLYMFKLESASGEYSVVGYFASACSGLLLVFLGVLGSRIKWTYLEPIKSFGAQTYWILIAHTVENLSLPWYHLRIESTSAYTAFLTEIFIRVLFIMLGCSIIKRISQYQYMRKRMAKYGK